MNSAELQLTPEQVEGRNNLKFKQNDQPKAKPYLFLHADPGFYVSVCVCVWGGGSGPNDRKMVRLFFSS